jgi:hypothetical protein
MNQPGSECPAAMQSSIVGSRWVLEGSSARLPVTVSYPAKVFQSSAPPPDGRLVGVVLVQV